jgi:hypothetical protein
MFKGKFLKEKKLDIQTLLKFLLRTHALTTPLLFPQKVVKIKIKA